MAPIFHIVDEPVINMREKSTHEAKVVSQTFFSEKILLENEEKGWIHIRTSDGYKGWILKPVATHSPNDYNPSLVTSELFNPIYQKKDNEYGPIKIIPFGSRLHLLDASDPRWIEVKLPRGEKGYIEKGNITSLDTVYTKKDLPLISQKFLGLPYLWGGRSSFGYDCSGFIQMLYNLISISLPRDARDQILDSRFQDIHLEDMEPGDLIFFGKSENTISHVGMSLEGKKFIHSVAVENKPWIRVSSLLDPEWTTNSCSRPFQKIRQLKIPI